MAGEIQYWILIGDSERGPLSYADLANSAKFGTLKKTDRVRLSSGEIKFAEQVGQFEYLPQRAGPPFQKLPFYRATQWQTSELGLTRLMFEYLITCWAVLFIAAVTFPILLLPVSFFLGLRALNLGARTAWLPMLISGVGWLAYLIYFAIKFNERINQGLY